jgi:phosphoribosylaminoimidazole-succinocarboxamide synthase
LPEPIFTPSTKAETGHDENINEQQAIQLVGADVFKTVKEKSIALYKFAKQHALKCGLVLADTKFEFGKTFDKEGAFPNIDGSVEFRPFPGEIILIDEALTPDSSRYWLKEKYDKGILESLDKQFVRNYLEQIKWDKSPPPPALPADVIKKTTERYLQAYKLLTGKEL